MFVSLIGSIGVIIELYVVLWGNAGEVVEATEETEKESCKIVWRNPFYLLNHLDNSWERYFLIISS